MKTWIKGAILGGVWGLLPVGIELLEDVFRIEITIFFNQGILRVLSDLLFFPFMFAIKLGFHFILVFIGAPLIGAIIGGFLGFFYSKYKGGRIK